MKLIIKRKTGIVGLICTIIGAVGLLAFFIFCSSFTFATPIGEASSQAISRLDELRMISSSLISVYHLTVPLALLCVMLIVGIIFIIISLRTHKSN